MRKKKFEPLPRCRGRHDWTFEKTTKGTRRTCKKCELSVTEIGKGQSNFLSALKRRNEFHLKNG